MSSRRAKNCPATSKASRAVEARPFHIWNVNLKQTIVVLVVGSLTTIAFGAFFLWKAETAVEQFILSESSKPVELAPEDETRLRETCSHCHQFSSPDSLPRGAWKETIWQMYEHSGYGRTVKWRVEPDSVIAWYEKHSPENFVFDQSVGVKMASSPFSREPINIQSSQLSPVVANIEVANVTGNDPHGLIVCDALQGQVLLGALNEPEVSLRSIADIPNPCHAEVADLDADGRVDIVVANLGTFLAMDHNLGSVEWLRQSKTGKFERVTIKDGLGRVADVEPTDFDRDGDLDVVVAEFGWYTTGELLLLENRLNEKTSPSFESHVIDGIHGASHVDVADLDGDGVDELIVLYSQEHEMVRCYSHLGSYAFAVRDLYRAPSPAWGFTGSQIVDLDGDADLDILLSNGDAFDNTIVKPYHGIQWLENTGDLNFSAHTLANMWGVYRAAAADLDGDGDQDVAACALIPNTSSDLRKLGDVCDSLVWFEQTTTGVFVRHQLEAGNYEHPTLAIADYNLDGNADLLVGNGRLELSVNPRSKGCLGLWLGNAK